MKSRFYRAFAQKRREVRLTSSDPEAGREAVREVVRHLYDPAGGVVAQFEFGPGGNPAVAFAIFDEWDTFRLPQED